MKIIHVLSDGTVKDSIKGHKLKPENAQEFYEILRREIERRIRT